MPESHDDFPESVSLFLILLADALRHIRSEGGPEKDLALDVTDAILNNLDKLQRDPRVLHPERISADKDTVQQMVKTIVGYLMDPDLCDS